MKCLIMLNTISVTSNTEFQVTHPWTSNHRTPLRWILSHLRRHWIWCIGILVGALGNAGGAAIMSISLGDAFNAVAKTSPDFVALRNAAILIVLSQLARAVVQFFRNFSSELIGQRMERDMRDELYASLIGKPMSFHDRQSLGDVMARCTNDVREVGLFMSPGVNISIGSSSFIIMNFIFAPRIHPLLIVVPLGYVMLYVFLVAYFLGKLSPVTQTVRRKFGQMNSALSESIEGIETVKGAAQEQRESNRFAKTLGAWRDASVAQGDVESQFLPGLLFGLTMAVGLLLSFWLFTQGQIQIGDVVSFASLLTMLQFPSFATQFAYPSLASGHAGAKRMLELMKGGNDMALSQPPAGLSSALTTSIRGEVAFRDVTFSYDRNKGTDHTLKHISFCVKAGQTVAIVGQTGSGKSSIIKLINRIYDPNSGEIWIDGRDSREWDLAALRQQISIIEQDIFLWSRTIAENIAYGMPNATRTQIESAAKAAQAHAFIMGFKDGYDTVVGERGVTLSGGQRQRIAIARAFLTDPRILILDDSTSAIDSATENEIQRAILRAAQGRTTFIITHRLSQIRWADVIIVIKNGRVDAVGNHHDLMQSSQAYRDIFKD
jgi:ATP-binding cassette subfamily B protein